MKDFHVVRSIEWLIKIQNDDGGWGMYDYDPSRILTTAEAVTALAIANVNNKAIEKGIGYLITQGNNSKWCQYTRHHAWTIYALTLAGQKNEIPERCFQALQRSSMQGAWSHKPREHPNLFATFLALRALDISGKSKVLVSKARQWIAQQSKGSYWTFSDNKPSFAATSYAILAITSQADWQNSYSKQVTDSLNFLREGEKTNFPAELNSRTSGDSDYNFHHCSLSWVLMAFLSAGLSVFDPLIIRLVDQLYNNLYCKETGGWSEEENHRPSVFATSHAIAALEVFYKTLSVEDYLNNLKGRNLIMSNNVFVVHGHDASAKHEVARFLESIGCNAIILDEQVDSGLTTIFQKLEQYANDVSYAIVLLTPDDLAEDDTGNRAARARQNVILELGLFLGKLGAEKVCLAKKGNIDIPSDISGVLYLDIDNGGWKLSLAKKLKKAGIPIDLDRLF